MDTKREEQLDTIIGLVAFIGKSFEALLLMITVPLWIIPYSIYKKRKLGE